MESAASSKAKTKEAEEEGHLEVEQAGEEELVRHGDFELGL